MTQPLCKQLAKAVLSTVPHASMMSTMEFHFATSVTRATPWIRQLVFALLTRSVHRASTMITIIIVVHVIKSLVICHCLDC